MNQTALRSACLLILAVATATTAEEGFSDSIWPAPVHRLSSDRQADLLATLLRLGRHQQATELCRYHLRSADPQSDRGALWHIRLSAALAAAQLAQESFGPAQVQQAQQPVVDLLSAYPNHRRKLFLEAQRLGVQRDAARHRVVKTSVSPSTKDRIEQASKQLLRVTTEMQDLSQRVGDERARQNSERGQRDYALIADLRRLEQELLVDAVSLSIMQTELFADGSQDQLAAATQAESAADQAAAKLPADSPARREVKRLRIEALIRTGRFEQAELELLELARNLPQGVPANVLAMQVRVDIGRERITAAQRRLGVYYGDSPATAPPSVEMDRARLEYLLASDHGGEGIGPWLDAIERRSGLYARRRAEAVSLARLGSANGGVSVDPSLVAAQAQDWLRRGNPARAGQLFSAAAAAERDSQRALRHATQAAAALVAADQQAEAANVLAQIAVRHVEAPNASAVHLQAAMLYHSSGSPDLSQRLESLLTAQLSTWPESEQAASARQWLIRLLDGQKRSLEAAQVATRIPPAQLDAANLDRAVEHWRTAIEQSPDDQLQAAMRAMRQSFRPLLNHRQARSRYRSAAAYLLDRELLLDLPERGNSALSDEEMFCEALLSFRRSGTVTDPLESPPPALTSTATWRLMRDGRQQPAKRQAIAKLLQTWPGTSGPSIPAAERLVWLERIQDAQTMLRGMINTSQQPRETLRQAAAALAATDHQEAKLAAIDLWDQLAAGVPQGSRLWHEAKLAAITLLRQVGQRADASRRAKYILLTSEPDDEDLKQRYQSASLP
ncbi:MAG: hypothetical protein MI861_09920 [Pirellulales bacterium]|nr:hypothetical protein [Pirellulales bacterium]